MRARNLKPGLFKNELLGSADPLITILFAGLWCSADREGRLEDRPLRLCAEVFPYRRTVTAKKIDSWLDWLQTHGFIARYRVAEERFIQVREFLTHQNPHRDERMSKIPALSTIAHGASTVNAQCDLDKSTDVARLNPESGILNPESSLRERARGRPRTPGKHEGNGGRGVIDAGDRLTQQTAADCNGLDAWRDAGCDPQAMETWLAHLEQLSPPKALSGASRIHAAQILRGMGDADTQRRAVQTAAANGWKSLRLGDGKQAAAASPAQRMRTAQEIAALYPEDAA